MCMSLEHKFTSELKKQGADFVYFVDISNLQIKQNKRFHAAVLFGIALCPEYLQKVSRTPKYVQKMKQINEIEKDEFHLTELKTDKIADTFAKYLTETGFSAYSQSEENIYNTGHYNKTTKSTPLPHKTIALMAGIGWIGKHNLLITPEFGSAISMCTVLTNAPLKTILKSPTQAQCGSCTICKEICPVKAIKGKSWEFVQSRDEIVNVYKCSTCLECMVLCPFTQAYINKHLAK